MLKDFRDVSFHILNNVLIKKEWVKNSLDEYFNVIDYKHRDLQKIYELVYGILREKKYIDYIINKYLKYKTKDEKIRNILRIGYYQIKYMDSIPDYAAINSCVELSKKYFNIKISKFINAVLRNISHDIKKGREKQISINKTDIIKYLSIVYSYEEFLIKHLLKYYNKDKLKTVLEAGNKKPPLYIKVNTLKITKKKLKELFDKEKIKYKDIKIIKNALEVLDTQIIKSKFFDDGLFYVQDLSSQIFIELVSINDNDKIIEIGSAPGGKTAHLAEKMHNKGQIIAVENSEDRIKLLEDNLLRLGVNNVKILNMDATLDIKSFYNMVDKLILDAPCSSLGVIRRHPEKKWILTNSNLKKFPEYQFRILNNVKNWVKNGGYIFYSTCTINPEENEKVIERFLKENKDFKIQNILKDNKDYKEFKKSNYFLSIPGNSLNADGFFIAKIKRIK